MRSRDGRVGLARAFEFTPLCTPDLDDDDDDSNSSLRGARNTGRRGTCDVHVLESERSGHKMSQDGPAPIRQLHESLINRIAAGEVRAILTFCAGL